jgi:hypothetical protein
MRLRRRPNEVAACRAKEYTSSFPTDKRPGAGAKVVIWIPDPTKIRERYTYDGLGRLVRTQLPYPNVDTLWAASLAGIGPGASLRSSTAVRLFL